MQVKDLDQAEICVTEQRQLCKELKAQLSRAQLEMSALQSTHTSQADNARKQISKLEEDLQAAKQQVSMVESKLQDSLAKEAMDGNNIQRLDSIVEELKLQLQSGTEQIDTLTSELQTKAAAYDVLTAEHENGARQCQELSASLQQCEEELQAKIVQLEQAVADAQSQKSNKVNFGAFPKLLLTLSY